MSTTGAFNKKNPTIKRILKEASEIASSPSPDYHAEPLETDLFEWHFTLRGPPSPSHFAEGIYHGRISLPPSYPLRPPSFKFTTPTGRFETNREICLSISGHHEETWQPAWGIRTALVAIRSFMDTDAKGQVGGLDSEPSLKVRLAKESTSWKCTACGKTNQEIMTAREDDVRAMGQQLDSGIQENVPNELKLAYREDLAGSRTPGTESNDTPSAPTVAPSNPQPQQQASSIVPPAAQLRSASIRTEQPPAPDTAAPLAPPQIRVQADADTPAWLDKAIYGVAIALIFMILRQFG